MNNKNENCILESDSREALSTSKGISFIKKLLDNNKISQSFLYKNMKIYDNKTIYPIWCDLMDKERLCYYRLGITSAENIEAPPESDDALTKYFQRFMKGKYPTYFSTLPIYLTLLYCNNKKIDEIIATNNNTVTNSFKPALKKELNAFCEEINLDEKLTEIILEGDDENYLLPLLISVFYFERFEKQDSFALILEKCYFELIYKNRYLDYLYELTKINEISGEHIPRHMRINEYYVLPTIYPKLCNQYSDHIRTKIICGPGCGKTTALRALIAACINEGDNQQLYDAIVNEWMDNQIMLNSLFPIYIDSTNIDAYNEEVFGSLNNLLQLVIIDNIEEHNNALKVIDYQIKQFKDANLLVLIDGLDEVKTNNRLKLAKLINDFVKTHTNVNIIIASRQINFENYEHDEYGHTIDAICDLKESTLNIAGKEKEIITKWAKILGENDSWIAETDAFITNNEYLHELSNNPFLLATMVCERAGGLSTPYSILDRLIDKMVEKRRRVEELTYTEVRTLLSYIAWDMIMSGTDNIHRDILKKKYDEASLHSDIFSIDRTKWNRLSDEINTRAGLIIYDQQSCSYSFQDTIIQKFLAAEWLLRWFVEKYEDSKYINNPDIYTIECTKPILEELWNRLCQISEDVKIAARTWRDIIIMMMVSPKGKWRTDTGKIAIVPIFNYLVTLISITLNQVQVKSICEIFKAMCLESFSSSDVTRNERLTQDNRKILLRILYNNRNMTDIEQCIDKWAREFKVLEEENLINT